jgi:hypothetical protein
VRFSLFHYNVGGTPGGVADFDFMQVTEPRPRGLTAQIPFGRSIGISAAGRDTPFAIDGVRSFTVVDRGLGRVALRAGERYVSITPTTDSSSTVALRTGPPRIEETFQWMESLYGDLLLMSLSTHRYLRIEPDGRLTSDSRGAEPDPEDGTAMRWRVIR